MSPSSHRVLVLNAGSSTLKWTVLESGTDQPAMGGVIPWEGLDEGQAMEASRAVLERLPQVNAIGHRIVHGGTQFRESICITAEVRAAILALAPLDPLHARSAVAAIDAASSLLPGVPQVAAFDTAFHATIPEAAALYALPWAWTEKWNLRRFGFHGLSVAYAARRSAELLGAVPARLVVAHLGNGCSVTAVAGGSSIDTTMGFTPLEGVMMGTRAGSIDPGLLLYLQRNCAVGLDELEHGLQAEAGLLGVSGVSSDLRRVLDARASGAHRASLAYDMFVGSVRKAVGSLVTSLGGLDAMVFTGGIGEHSAEVRADVASGLRFLGVVVDVHKNASAKGDADIAASGEPVRVLTIAAREDLAIVDEVRRVLGWATLPG